MTDLEKELRLLLGREETEDLVPPYTCLPPSCLAWNKIKGEAIVGLLLKHRSRPELRKKIAKYLYDQAKQASVLLSELLHRFVPEPDERYELFVKPFGEWEDQHKTIKLVYLLLADELLLLYPDEEEIKREERDKILVEFDMMFDLAPEDDAYLRILVKDLHKAIKAGKWPNAELGKP